MFATFNLYPLRPYLYWSRVILYIRIQQIFVLQIKWLTKFLTSQPLPPKKKLWFFGLIRLVNRPASKSAPPERAPFINHK